MRGVEEYKNKFKKRTENKILCNNDIEYLEDFYYFVKVKPKESTVYNYINYVINFLRFNNITKPEDLKLIHFTRYMAHIDDQKQSSQIAIYHALQKYSKFLSANKINEDYMSYVDRPEFYEDQETKSKREKSFLTEDEIKSIINSVMNSNKSDVWKQRDYTIILLLLTSGIRCSALYKLDVSDVNFSNNSIVVTEKRDNVREIILPVITMIELRKWIDLRNTLDVNNIDALFVSNQKSRMDSRSISRVSSKYGYIEGKSVHPHMYRSTFGTTMWKKSGDLFLTQKSMGHSNPKTTELYIRGEDRAIKERTASIMEDYISVF